MTFCALCIADIPGTPQQAPLGRGNALVNVCDDCHDQPAREVNGAHGYACDGTRGTTRNAVAPASNVSRQIAPSHKQRDGWCTVRIPRRDKRNRPRDEQTARKLVGHPQAHHVATTLRWFVYQVPPRRVLEVGGELDAIEQWRDP